MSKTPPVAAPVLAEHLVLILKIPLSFHIIFTLLIPEKANPISLSNRIKKNMLRAEMSEVFHHKSVVC